MRLQYKIRRPDFDEAEHPRDRLGRFIETGAHVSIWGGATGTVLRNVGGGRLEVRRDGDDKPVIVHRNYLTVTARPDGGKPVTDVADAPAPAPVEAPSEDAVEEDVSEPENRLDEVARAAQDAARIAAERNDDAGGYQPTDDEIGAAIDEQGDDGRWAAEDAADSLFDDDPPEETGHDVSKDVVEEQATVYTFPAEHLDAAIASIERANRRAERAGVKDRIGYKVTTEDRKFTDQFGITTYVPYATLTLDRPTVQHDGWSFVATLTWDSETGSLITRSAPGATLLNRPEARQCDVCRSARDRRDTYVVQRGDEELQVGSNCLTQFMGIRPAGLWMLGWEPDITEEPGDPRAPRGETRVGSVDLMAWTLAITKDRGWLSRGRATEGQVATADVVTSAMLGRSEADGRLRDRYAADAEEAREEAQRLLDFARTIDGDSDYAENLRAAAAGDSVSFRNIPLLASAVAAYRMRQEQDQRRRAEREETGESEHIGTVGEKIENVPARVLSTRLIDGFRGPSTLFTLMTEDGNVVKWFASGNKMDLCAVGDTVKVKGTIKAHGEFRGVKETTLTRAKIERTGEALAAQRERERKAEEARAAAEAERAAIIAARMNPRPEGYIEWDHESAIPPGTVVRAQQGSVEEMRLAHVIAGPFDRDGVSSIMLRFVDYPWSQVQPVTSVGSIAPESEQNIAEGQEIARRALEDTEALPGQTPIRHADRDAQAASLRPGETVRAYFDFKYQNVVVVSVNEDASPPTAVVRTPDGKRREVMVRSITARG
jgi:hypothetical protein